MSALQVAGYLLLAVLQAVAYAVRGLGAALVFGADRALNQRQPAQRPARAGSARRPPGRSTSRRPRRTRKPWTARAGSFVSTCAAATVQGWLTGWKFGRVRQAEFVRRREQARRRAAVKPAPQTPAPQPAAPQTAPPAPPPADPAAQQGATVTPIRKAPMPTQTQPAPWTAGEASGYESTLATLDNLLTQTKGLQGVGEQTTGSLSSAISEDSETLGDVMAIDDAFDAAVAAIEKAKATFIRRHGDIAEAVGSNPQAAGSTGFYKN